MATHHTPGRLELQVRVPAGRCEIETADTAETVVEAVPMNASSASRSAVECLVEKLSERPDGGHELRVEVPKHKRLLPGFGDAQVLIRVRGPHGLDLDAGTASADVIVTGRPRCADVRTASGDVSIEVADGAVQVKTASGDVNLGQMRDATDVKTMSGDVVVRESGSATDVNTMSGDVRIRRADRGRDPDAQHVGRHRGRHRARLHPVRRRDLGVRRRALGDPRVGEHAERPGRRRPARHLDVRRHRRDAGARGAGRRVAGVTPATPAARSRLSRGRAAGSR